MGAPADAPIIDLSHAGTFTMPPADLLPSLTKQIEAATDGLEPGEMAVVGAGDNHGGKGAFVAKTENGIEVLLWIGLENWRDPGVAAGFTIRKKWKRT